MLIKKTVFTIWFVISHQSPIYAFQLNLVSGHESDYRWLTAVSPSPNNRGARLHPHPRFFSFSRTSFSSRFSFTSRRARQGTCCLWRLNWNSYQLLQQHHLEDPHPQGAHRILDVAVAAHRSFFRATTQLLFIRTIINHLPDYGAVVFFISPSFCFDRTSIPSGFTSTTHSLHCHNERLRITSIPTSPASPKKPVEQGNAIQTVSIWSLECIERSNSHNLTSPEILHISTTTLFKHQLTLLTSFIWKDLDFRKPLIHLILSLLLAPTKCVGNHLYNTLDLLISLTLHHHSECIFLTH